MTTTHSVRRLLVALAVLAAPSLARGENHNKFDLICSGTARSGKPFRAHSAAFQDRFSIDLKGKRFCDTFSCDVLAEGDDKLISYECDTSDRKQFCAAGTIADTGGPFIQRDRFSFDRLMRKFTRSMSGEIGDRTSSPYSAYYDGACEIGPFTDQKPRAVMQR